MRLRRTLLASLAIVAAMASNSIHAAQRLEPARVMLEAGKKKEVVDGDLKGAIEQYGIVVSKFANDRQAVADALVRMADCYQRLGDSESRKIYERIVREYADQRQAVDVARARLGRHSESSDSRVSFRQIWKLPPGGDTVAGPISADGRYLAYVDWAQHGDLFVHDFSSDTNRRLTNTATDGLPGATVDQFALSASFSRDGRQVAYTWFRSDKTRFELRLMGVRGEGIPQSRLLFDSPEVGWIGPSDWSPDGKLIAVGVARTDKTSQIGLISVGDGALRVLKSVDWRSPTSIIFSPDGKYLAYDVPADDSTDHRDIFVLAIDGSREIPAIVGPSQDTIVGWSNDGKRLLFASDRNGSQALWSVPFADGKVEGAAELLRRDIGQFSQLGVMDGKLYGIVHRPNSGGSRGGDIHTATIDLATGRLESPLSLAVQTHVGNNTFPAWSSDGKNLAYGTRRGFVGSPHFIIAIRSLDTGEIREISPSPGLGLLYSLTWTSDGRSLFAVGGDTKGRYGIFSVDAQTGRTSPLVTKEDKDAIPTAAGISPDGKKLYYGKPFVGAADQRGARVSWIEKDLTSGGEKELLRTPNVSGGRLSPDGKYLALAGTDPSKPRALAILPIAGGEPREIAPDVLRGLGLDWTADSSAVYVLQTGELWRIPIDGSEPRKIDLKSGGSDPQVSNFRVHPDGRRIVFQTPVPSNPAEIWVLENFLPALKASK